MNTMNTFSGKVFDPMEMTTDDVELQDIAHALSMLCRGGGHLKFFYSVGQHSINCAREALARGWSRKLALACLLHDASEAYISDIIRPVKVHLSNYLVIEEQIMDTILKKYDLDDLSAEEHVMWKQIDDEMLDNELAVMLTGEENRKPVKLAATPDFAEHSHREIEQVFYEMAQQLL
ncbi:MAG: phosphohydrolase [Eubacterium sp.]|nr:phosphohydrolase [Eubacterium sp.]